MIKDVTPIPPLTWKDRIYSGTHSVVLLTLAVLGTVFEHTWAWNITKFLIWLILIVTIGTFLLAMEDAALRRKTAQQGMPLPRPVFFSVNAAFALLIVATGHWFYGLLWVIRTVFYIGIYDAEKFKNEQAKHTAQPPVIDV